MNSPYRKFDLYVLSLAALFVFFIVLTFKLPADFNARHLKDWGMLLCTNPVSLCSFIALVYAAFGYLKFNFDLNGAPEIPFQIVKIESANYEHLTFLATYIVPLVSFDFASERQMIVLAVLLVLMGVIYIKTDLFYANPSLALLGFHIYKVDGKFKNDTRTDIILICREKLKLDQKVSYLKLDERIYFVRGAKQ